MTVGPTGSHIQMISMLDLYMYLQNQDPQQAPPAKKQKVSSDNDDDVVIDLEEEKRDGNLKELLIRMEKMERR